MNKKNETPLHFAARKNFKEIGELLISRGAKINAKTKKAVGRKSPLHYAIEKNSIEMIKILISKGANINGKDCIYHILIQLFLIMIIYNRLRKLNHQNQTPLHYEAKKNSVEIGELLISNGASVNAKDLINLILIILLTIKIISK